MSTKTGNSIFNIVNGVVFILLAIICIFPLYYIIVLTISDNSFAASGKLILFPKGLNFQNYINIFKLQGIGHAFIMSVLKSIIGTIGTLLGSSFLAYLFTKKNMFMRTFLYRLVIVTMFFNAGLIPWFITMNKLHLTNNFLAYILPYVVSAYYVIIIKTYVENIPAEMEESAKIDGASFLKIYVKIILPLSKPILATVTVYESVNQWNNLRDNLFLMTKVNLNTIQLILYKYISEADAIASQLMSSGGVASAEALKITPQAVTMTIAIIAIVPILCIYPFMQRYFEKGLMLGAVKG